MVCGLAFRFQFVALRCMFLARALAVPGTLRAVFLATAMMFGAASRVPLRDNFNYGRLGSMGRGQCANLPFR